MKYATLLLTLVFVIPASGQRHDVFSYLRTSLSQSEGDLVTGVEAAATESGLEVFSTATATVPDSCPYSATVISIHDGNFAASLFALNAHTAPYATVDRVLVFEDERGTHVSMINPPAVARTVLLDSPEATALAEAHRQKLLRVFGLLPGAVSREGYGPSRSRGLIGKTMGVMAGGPFDEKIQVHATWENAAWMDATDAVVRSLSAGTESWGLGLVYRVDYPDESVSVLGISGGPMEARSFDIVKEGADESRADLKCPGIAHAAAYPLEVVVRQRGNDVDIEFIDAMYRMKLYFEDAGKWAFMKNMGMPGSIADDLKEVIERAGGAM